MNARVFISALALLALAGAGSGASAQAIDPDIVEQTEREPTEAGRLPRCPGDPRCAEPDTIMIDEYTVERMARDPMSPSMEGMGEDGGRMPRCPGDPRCGEREGEIVPRQTPRPDP